MKKNSLYLKIFFCIAFLTLSSFLTAKPFVVGRLQGQLGNQFFQIAATVSLALENNATPLFPDLAIKQSEGFPINYRKIFSNLNVNQPQGNVQFYYNEPRYSYDPIPFQPNMELSGYFQSEKYFAKYKQEIIHLFSPSREINAYLEKKYEHILMHPNSVAIHIRSYLKEDPNQRIYPNYGREYVEKAIMKFPADSLFIVCSNNINWCKDMLAHIPRRIIYIEGETHYHDFYLMSKCRHNIISNSSFSWWAAYLNPNPNKIVIAPPEWVTSTCGLDYKDVLPNEWTVLY